MLRDYLEFFVGLRLEERLVCELYLRVRLFRNFKLLEVLEFLEPPVKVSYFFAQVYFNLFGDPAFFLEVLVAHFSFELGMHFILSYTGANLAS